MPGTRLRRGGLKGPPYTLPYGSGRFYSLTGPQRVEKLDTLRAGCCFFQALRHSMYWYGASVQCAGAAAPPVTRSV